MRHKERERGRKHINRREAGSEIIGEERRWGKEGRTASRRTVRAATCAWLFILHRTRRKGERGRERGSGCVEGSRRRKAMKTNGRGGPQALRPPPANSAWPRLDAALIDFRVEFGV